MTRKSKLIILVSYLLIMSIVMLTYRTNRAKKVKQLRAQIRQELTEKEKVRNGEAELARLVHLFPASANNASVVEALYLYGKESGLKWHSVATEPDKKQSAARLEAAKASGGVSSTTIQVTVSGNFRQIAEYIRRLQNMERFNRIVEFKLTPDDAGVKGSLTIEIFSLAVKS